MKAILTLTALLLLSCVSREIPHGQNPDISVMDVNAVSPELVEQDFFRFESDREVFFDIDDDQKEERLFYDIFNRELQVQGYPSISIDKITEENAEMGYFIILKYSDAYDFEMTLLGILEWGPSFDPVTTLFTVLLTEDPPMLVSVAKIPAEVVGREEYNEHLQDDFNYKAYNIPGEGISSPLRLNHMGFQTWFGRTLFTYYSTYRYLVDNGEKYDRLYKTRSTLNTLKDIPCYAERDADSSLSRIAAGQTVLLQQADNRQWIWLEAGDGTAGWVDLEQFSQDNFSGFSYFD